MHHSKNEFEYYYSFKFINNNKYFIFAGFWGLGVLGFWGLATGLGLAEGGLVWVGLRVLAGGWQLVWVAGCVLAWAGHVWVALGWSVCIWLGDGHWSGLAECGAVWVGLYGLAGGWPLVWVAGYVLAWADEVWVGSGWFVWIGCGPGCLLCAGLG